MSQEKNLDIYIYPTGLRLENVMERAHDTCVCVCVFHRQ